jgi:hypothetical protein
MPAEMGERKRLGLKAFQPSVEMYAAMAYINAEVE